MNQKQHRERTIRRVSKLVVIGLTLWFVGLFVKGIE